MKAAQEIAKNNQTATYVIDDMCEAIEEMKVAENASDIHIRTERQSGLVTIDEKTL